MTPSFFTQWFSEPLVHALCWTLIHSLWIGLLAAGLAGLAMMVTTKAPARLRYLLFCGVLWMFTLTMGLVFCLELTGQRAERAVVATEGPLTDWQASPAITITIASNDIALIHQIVDFINDQLNWIFTIWLIFFVYKSLKMIGGLYQVHRIRTQKVKAVSDEWAGKLSVFCRRLGIGRSIRLLESELVKVPVTVGFFKPVILLPMGLVFQLPPEQIETILWHELAHIWRRDYLVNLFQSLMEAIFFFNPGVIWLSSLIREEREACCDDIVLAHTTGKSHYVEALLAFQLQTHLPPNSMALGLGSHQLINRLRRMVSAENKRLSLIEKVALLIGLVLVSAFSVIPRPEQATAKQKLSPKKAALVLRPSIETPLPTEPVSKKLPKQESVERTVSAIDTLPVTQPKSEAPTYGQLHFASIMFVNNNHDMVNREMIVQDDKGNRYHLTIANSKLVALDVNDKSIPETEIEQHQELLQQIDRAFTETQRAKRANLAEARVESDAKRQQGLQAWKEAQKRKLANRGQDVQPEKQPKKGLDKFLLQNAIPTEPKKAEQPIAVVKKQKHASGAKADSVAKTQVFVQKKRPQQPDNTYDRERVLGVIAALVQNHVVTDQAGVEWFGLSDTELVVNGVRQSSELHQQLKEKYGIKPKYGLFYGPIQMAGKGIIFDKEDLTRE